MITRISSGKIFVDEFESSQLNDKWTVLPNDPLRYNLTEVPGHLVIYHGDTDIMFLVDEPENYVLDVKNDYIPSNSVNQAGVIIYKSAEDNIEVLEYFDVEQNEKYVYKYIRVVKYNNVYTIYGKNSEQEPWEVFGSIEFEGAGKVGLIVKGPLEGSSSQFLVDYFRLYRSNEIHVVNVPQGYKIVIKNAQEQVIGAKTVQSPYNGVSIKVDALFPVLGYIEVYNENNELVTRSTQFDLCGGDVFYYGAVLQVLVDGHDLFLDGEYFMGYYINNEINFQIEIRNPFDNNFDNVTISAQQYGNNRGWEFVNFSMTQDGPFVPVLNIGTVPAHSSVFLYGKIIRDPDVLGLEIDPFRFYLKVSG